LGLGSAATTAASDYATAAQADQTVSLTGSGATSVSGTYPNFTITSTDTNTDTNTTYTAGSGITLTGTVFSNSAPDQTVALTGSGGTTVSGTYPNFTISSAASIDGTTINPSAVQIGGTTVIDSSRNLTNVGTLNGGTPYTTANDGSGSGLDADTVDGTHLSGIVTRDFQDSSRNLNIATNSTGAAGLFMKASNGAFRFQLYGNGAEYGFLDADWGNWDIRKTPNGQMTLRAGNADHTVWHAGNDGSGSGLDADLLDGLHSTSFASSTFNVAGGASNSDPNSRTDSHFLTDNSNAPFGSVYSHIQNHWWSSVGGNVAQNATTYNGSPSRFAVRHRYSGTWTPWSEAWTNNNDGSGSGLDADLLDGIDSTYFNRGDNVYGVMVGASGWNMNDLFTTRNRSGFFDVWGGSNFPPSTSHVHGMQVRHNASAHYGWQLAGQYGQNKLWHRQVSNNSWGAWNQQWGSGNDGSGSGLDADLLDGLHASSLVRSDAADTMTGTYTFTGGHGAINLTSSSILSSASSNWTGNPGALGKIQYHSNRWYIVGDSASNRIVQFRRDGSDKSYIDNNGTLIGGGMWSSYNDGSGSGLDADVLDGVQASQFLRSDVADTQTSQLTVARLKFTGEGGNSNVGNDRYAIYQEAGAWSNPYPDLIIGYHTGIKIGGHRNYNGTRFYNDNPTNGTEIFSVGNGDNHVRVLNNLKVSSQTDSYSYIGNGNVSGTGAASYHPSGIYSTGNNWLYGTQYMNGNDTYFQGGSVRSVDDIVSDQNYGYGLVGVYSATRYQHVWSMGAAYRTNAAGTSVGNMYGLTFTHTNIGTGTNQAISGLSHQLQGRANGGLWWALGSGIWTTGNITAYSDISVKTNLERIPDALSKVCQINGYTYDRTDYEPDSEGIMPETRQAGVVAQEVEKVLPEVVSGEEGNKAVAYGNMVSLLIEAIKEQQGQIEDLKQEIQALKVSS
jgi:hypothetical protein